MPPRASLKTRFVKIDEERERLGRQILEIVEKRSKSLLAKFPELHGYKKLSKSQDYLPYIDDPIIDALFLADPKRRLSLAIAFRMASTSTIYSCGKGEGLVSWRDRSAILIKSIDGCVRSWSAVRSLTGYGRGKISKHLSASRYPNASRFSDKYNPVNLELAVFASGVGHLSGASRIFMYGRFNASIGMASDGAGNYVPTEYVKVQFDKVARPKRGPENRKTSQGYFLKSHGFPISLRELQTDFPAGAACVKKMALQP